MYGRTAGFPFLATARKPLLPREVPAGKSNVLTNSHTPTMPAMHARNRTKPRVSSLSHIFCLTSQVSHDPGWRGACASTTRDSWGRCAVAPGSARFSSSRIIRVYVCGKIWVAACMTTWRLYCDIDPFLAALLAGQRVLSDKYASN